MDLKAIDFPYTKDITCVSEKQFDVHLSLYNGYITKANEIADCLKDEAKKTGNATYSVYRGLKKGQSYALDGVILHELYFNNIGGHQGAYGNNIKEKLAECFGSYNGWVTDFKACALSARGWAVLAYEQRSGKFINIVQDTHDDGLIMGTYPLIVLDMYEHAYFIDYANKKEEYFNKFMEDINWEAVCSRYEVLAL